MQNKATLGMELVNRKKFFVIYKSISLKLKVLLSS